MIQKEQFILTGANDKTILGDLTYDDNHTNPDLILFVHGFKGFKDWGAHHLVAQYFAEKGYKFLKFNLSHSGVTQENPHDVTDLETFAANTISYELADVNTVVNYISHLHPSSNLTIIGHSRGGGLALIKAAIDARINKIVTWSSIADFGSLWKPEQEEEWERTGKIYIENARTKEEMPLNSTLLTDFRSHQQEYDILTAAKQLTIPWLIVHGDDDVNVPFSVAEQLKEAQPAAQLKRIHAANHVYGASHPYTEETLPPQLQEVVESTLKFIQA
ncbi:alpha/beta hydrolase family protein [Pedobacter sp.]|uniref:alpha/beta hydrolase family protein n=1 Tax=Pedobacter sp. TaxID=1411316 RepID=UPI003D7F51A6